MTIVKYIHGAVRTFSSGRVLGLIFGLLLLSVASAEARPYRVGWDRNVDNVTAGYRVYYGTSSGAYQPTAGIDVGNVQEFTLDLTPGQTYFFVVRAYNSSSALGPPSTEMRFTVPLGASVAVNTASVSPGATITATVSDGPGNPLDWVGFFPSGASVNGAIDWRYLNGTRTVPATGASGGTVSFVAPSTLGTYVVRFYSSSNTLLASSITITVDGTPSVTAPSSVSAGQTFSVAVANGPANRYDMVALYLSSSTSTSAYLDWKYLNGSQVAPTTGTANANLTFTAPASAGQYVVRFMYNNGSSVLATSGIITVVANTGVSVTPSVTTLSAGSSLIAQIRNGPGGRSDWVGLFPVGAPNTSAVAMYYLNGTLTPPATALTNANVAFTAPLTAGQYNLRFFPNNSMTALATSAAITVTSLTVPPPPSTTPTVTPSVTSVGAGGSVTAQVRNGPAGSTDWVGLFPVGAPNTSAVAMYYLNGTLSAPATGLANADVTFTAPLTAGQYNLRFFPNNGMTALATSATITVTSLTVPPPPSTTPTVTPSVTSVSGGANVTAQVRNGPAGRTDWIGLYQVGAGQNAFIDWFYLNGTKVAPATGISSANVVFRMPTVGGQYNFRLFANESYSLLSTSTAITVTATTTPPPPPPSTGPSVTPSTTTVARGSYINVTVANSVTRTDWIGVYLSGQTYVNWVDWTYLNGTKVAPVTWLSNTTFSLRMPSTPGTYVLRLYVDNTYTLLANSVNIVVQ